MAFGRAVGHEHPDLAAHPGYEAYVWATTSALGLQATQLKAMKFHIHFHVAHRPIIGS
ncbi:hypothetical protein L083_5744 [Actinoplanes sp. N902-109]|nr:hypothetical protein L083_5744 [Actinoplanes sp. N902-109]